MDDITQHPEYDAFLRTCRRLPNDDLPRLVLADWLDPSSGDVNDLPISVDVAGCTVSGNMTQGNFAIIQFPTGPGTPVRFLASAPPGNTPNEPAYSIAIPFFFASHNVTKS